MHVDAWLSPSPQCPITMSPWWDAHGVGMKRIWRTCLSHRPMSEIKFFIFYILEHSDAVTVTVTRA